MAAIAALLLLYVSSRPAIADVKLWLPVMLSYEPEVRPLRGFFEVQPRFDEDITGLEAVLVELAVGRELQHGLTALVGYTWFPQFEDVVEHEQRVWQQLAYAREDASWETEARIRLEQRFLPSREGTSWRLRGRVSGEYGFARNWTWTIADEVFHRVNQTTESPLSEGFDQNRFETGVTRTIGQRTTLQPKYILQYQKPTSGGVFNHIASIGVEFAIP